MKSPDLEGESGGGWLYKAQKGEEKSESLEECQQRPGRKP